MRAALLAVALVASQELLDRTLALVGGQPITLSDARAALTFGLIESTKSAEPITDATRQLVDRQLILREVQRYATGSPGDTAINARLDEVRTRLSTAAAYTAALERHGFTETRLRAWVRDDLRAQMYLAQRFSSASVPTETELAQAYSRSKAEFDARGLTFAQAVPEVRERLVGVRRTELIADWLADLRRRTDIIIVP